MEMEVGPPKSHAVQISNRLKLLWAKTTVVSVEEKAYKDTSGVIKKVSDKRTNVSAERLKDGVKIGVLLLLRD